MEGMLDKVGCRKRCGASEGIWRDMGLCVVLVELLRGYEVLVVEGHEGVECVLDGGFTMCDLFWCCLLNAGLRVLLSWFCVCMCACVCFRLLFVLIKQCARCLLVFTHLCSISWIYMDF